MNIWSNYYVRKWNMDLYTSLIFDFVDVILTLEGLSTPILNLY